MHLALSAFFDPVHDGHRSEDEQSDAETDPQEQGSVISFFVRHATRLGGQNVSESQHELRTDYIC